MKDRKPSDESWAEKCERLDAERDAEEKSRRNEPKMVKVSRSFKFDSMFGWLIKLRNKMRKPNNPKLPMLAFFCALCMCSCMSATGPNGEKLAMVMTNTGFTTDKITESKSRANPIPLLGGGYNNDDLTTAKEAQQLTKITVGAISVEGVIDQGTPIDASLGWAYRITRAIVTGQVFKVGIKEYSAVSQAKTAADVSKHGATTSAGVTKALSKNRLEAVKSVGVPGEVPIQAIQSP